MKALWGILGVLIALALVVGAVALWSNYSNTPLPIDDRCMASVGDRNATITPEQAGNAAIIAGLSIRRGLKSRAASIALATAYQESGIRNLNYGHADSLGLFQQRPSQGWGSEQEVQDPWYSSNRFYREMVKVKGWEKGDINDIAQTVQRSAYPEAYRKHEDRARALASALTGETPASFSCVIGSPSPANPDGMATFFTKTLGKKVKVAREGNNLRITGVDEPRAWAVAQLAIANTAQFGLSSVHLGGNSWIHSGGELAQWRKPAAPAEITEVLLVFDQPGPS